MSKDEKELMDNYGITSERRTVYLYKGHKYDNFKDALNFATIDSGRSIESAKAKIDRSAD